MKLYSLSEVKVLAACENLNRRGDFHKTAIAKHITRRTGRRISDLGVSNILRRLENRGYVKKTPIKVGSNNRSTHYYGITPSGKKALGVSKKELTKLWK